MNQIAEYYEINIRLRRHFILYEKELAIKSSGPSLTATHKFELSKIKPNYNELLIRDKLINFGYFFLFISLILPSLKLYDNRALLIHSQVFFVFGIFLVAYLFKKIRYAQFLNINEVVAFDIAKIGKNKKQFDSFIEKLVNQINTVNTNDLKNNQKV